MKLKNKIVLITGASSGIGKAIATLFADNGAQVIICSHTSIEEGEEVAQTIIEKGGVAQYISCDLRYERNIKSLFSEVASTYGCLDVLINNAGRTFNVDLDSLSEETFINDVKTNLLSTVLCSKYAIPLMTNENGWIVNTSSIRGFDYTGRPGIMGYCASKAGVNSFTKNLAHYLAPRIFVNAVAPGFVHTKYTDSMNEEMCNSWIRNIPIGRFIEPEEIAEVYLLLATSKIFTGSIIVPDGGYEILGR